MNFNVQNNVKHTYHYWFVATTGNENLHITASYSITADYSYEPGMIITAVPKQPAVIVCFVVVN